jgi:diaminohydroxyphosphoribosylaminopyrimidine deaminase/5-amino-6-(5-phosphoribosylamino)uracil reductase
MGVRDFNPKVRGAGVRRLKAAGIEVFEGVEPEAAARLAQHFNAAMSNQRPFVTLKTGMTLDGRTATARGESKWITSKPQRRAARNLRRLFGGVLVGLQTALHDDPILLPEPRTRRPYPRVVLDSHLRLSVASRLVKSARQNPLILVCTDPGEIRRPRYEALGVTVISVQSRGGRVSLKAALRALFDAGFTSLLVEGGSEVLGSFVSERLFDEMVIFKAPMILGGRGSRPVVGGSNPERLEYAVSMKRAVSADSATLRYGLPDSDGLEVEVYERRPGRSSVRRR